mmetsp:Transcript_490/g.1822  ORF Transcript_490/g.1822 Transcript_490/m.1822 type:complete len:405 (-) Transcript_490:18-1232(-)
MVFPWMSSVSSPSGSRDRSAAPAMALSASSSTCRVLGRAVKSYSPPSLLPFARTARMVVGRCENGSEVSLLPVTSRSFRLAAAERSGTSPESALNAKLSFASDGGSPAACRLLTLLLRNTSSSRRCGSGPMRLRRRPLKSSEMSAGGRSAHASSSGTSAASAKLRFKKRMLRGRDLIGMPRNGFPERSAEITGGNSVHGTVGSWQSRTTISCRRVFDGSTAFFGFVSLADFTTACWADVPSRIGTPSSLNSGSGWPKRQLTYFSDCTVAPTLKSKLNVKRPFSNVTKVTVFGTAPQSTLPMARSMRRLSTSCWTVQPTKSKLHTSTTSLRCESMNPLMDAAHSRSSGRMRCSFRSSFTHSDESPSSCLSALPASRSFTAAASAPHVQHARPTVMTAVKTRIAHQ